MFTTGTAIWVIEEKTLVIFGEGRVLSFISRNRVTATLKKRSRPSQGSDTKSRAAWSGGWSMTLDYKVGRSGHWQHLVKMRLVGWSVDTQSRCRWSVSRLIGNTQSSCGRLVSRSDPQQNPIKVWQIKYSRLQYLMKVVQVCRKKIMQRS